MVKAQIGTYVGYTLLFFIISSVITMIPVLNYMSSFIQLLLGAGFYIYASKQQNNTAEFKDFFGGFSFILPIFLYTVTYLVILLPGFVILFGFVFPFNDFVSILTGGSNSPEILEQLGKSLLANTASTSGILSTLVAVIYFLYVGVSYILALPLIVIGKLNFWPAMEVSRRTIGKNFTPAVVMLLLLGIGISIATIVTCGVGLLVAFPMLYLVYFEMYNQIYETSYSEMDTEENKAE